MKCNIKNIKTKTSIVRAFNALPISLALFSLHIILNNYSINQSLTLSPSLPAALSLNSPPSPSLIIVYGLHEGK